MQILTSNRKLAKNDKKLKGVKAEYYTENGVYKYTYGNSKDYNEIQRIKKQLTAKFKEAFIVAFIDGKKADINEAIRIYKESKK